MLNLQMALKAIEAARKEAEKLGVKVSIVIVDGSGTLVAAERMDGALPVSPKFSLAKAYTAAAVGAPTAALAEFAVPGKPYYGIQNLDERHTTIAGGITIKEGNEIIGGIGVGGSFDTSQDVAIATAGLKALGL